MRYLRVQIIICDDVESEYVIIDSDNQVYFNKILLALNIIGIFVNMLIFVILDVTNRSFEFLKIM